MTLKRFYKYMPFVGGGVGNARNALFMRQHTETKGFIFFKSMSLQNSFKNVKRENLNFDSLVYYLGSVQDVGTLTENLQALYVSYTKVLFLCDEYEQIATNKEIYELLYELAAVIDIFKDMQKPNGQIKISM